MESVLRVGNFGLKPKAAGAEHGFIDRGRKGSNMFLWVTVLTSVALAVLIVYPLPYYVTHPEPRFRHLIEPELVVLGIYALGAVPSLVRTRFAIARGGPGPPLVATDCPAERPRQELISSK